MEELAHKGLPGLPVHKGQRGHLAHEGLRDLPVHKGLRGLLV